MQSPAPIEAMNYASAHDMSAILYLSTINQLWEMSASMEEFEFRVQQTVKARVILSDLSRKADDQLVAKALDNLNRLTSSPLYVLSTDYGYKLPDLPATLDTNNHWGVFLVANLVAALRRIEALENELAQMKAGK